MNNHKRHKEKSFVYRHDNPQHPSFDMSRWITRQSMPTDLPDFNGNSLEWHAFISQYRISSELCNFNNQLILFIIILINLARLQKCLKGKAREVVQSLLIFPDNVDRVIEVLESRFG